MAGLDRRLQSDFSGGMVRSVEPELVPEVGLVDAVNSFYDDYGGVYRRGGTTLRASGALLPGSPLTFLWDGWLASGQRTIIANQSRLATVSSTGSITEIYGSGFPTPRRAAAMDGILYIPGGVTYNGTTVGTAAKAAPFYASVASRLFAANGDRVDFSEINDPTLFNATDYHQLPGGVQIVGMEGLRDSVAVFTTDGIWIISNVAMDLTDAAGNVQHRLDQYSRDIVLWGNAGIAAWQGGLIVPAVDAIWQVSLGVTSEAPQPFARLTESIDPMYLDYVKRGYQPGLATVYRSHYMLPILDGTRVVDLLVCKLNSPRHPWSRMSGVGGSITALAVHKEAISPAPQLIGADVNGRVQNLSWFEPGPLVTVDADGSTFDWDMLLRATATGSLNLNTVMRMKAAYELVPTLTSSPVLKGYVLRDADQSLAQWGLFAWGQADWGAVPGDLLLSPDAPADLYGNTPHTWPVGVRQRFIQFRLRSSGAAQRGKLKRVEVLIRSSGRQ
jgi:hypothetical protein